MEDPKPHSKECRARFEKLIGDEKAEAARKAEQQHMDVQTEGFGIDLPGGIFDDGEEQPDGVPHERVVKRKTSAAKESAGGPATQHKSSASGSAGSTANQGSAGGPASQGAGGPADRGSAGSTAPQTRQRQAEDELAGQLAKRNKPTPNQPSKRAAEQAVDEFEREQNPNAGLPEVICGFPTLHDIPLAGYPEWGKLDEIPAYDERTGVALPPEKVKRARGRELDKMEEHKVKVDITWAKAKELGLKVVKSRWVDSWKCLPDDKDGVRSRCVAQEINTHQRDDVYSGTPPLKCHRLPQQGDLDKLVANLLLDTTYRWRSFMPLQLTV